MGTGYPAGSMSLGVRIRYRSREAGAGECMVARLPARIGRNAMNDCPLSHPFVSDFHAILEMSGSELCVRDLNSRNGLFDRRGTRLPAGTSVPLRALSGSFIVGQAVEVEVELLEDVQPLGERSSSSVHGMVLGNVAAANGMAAVPPLPPLSVRLGSRPLGPPRSVQASRRWLRSGRSGRWASRYNAEVLYGDRRPPRPRTTIAGAAPSTSRWASRCSR
jgi:FHA domain